jgi:hypothetical protein
MLNLRDTAPDLDPTFREGRGNVGIIRSPVRASFLPGNRGSSCPSESFGIFPAVARL